MPFSIFPQSICLFLIFSDSTFLKGDTNISHRFLRKSYSALQPSAEMCMSGWVQNTSLSEDFAIQLSHLKESFRLSSHIIFSMLKKTNNQHRRSPELEVEFLFWFPSTESLVVNRIHMLYIKLTPQITAVSLGPHGYFSCCKRVLRGCFLFFCYTKLWAKM